MSTRNEITTAGRILQWIFQTRKHILSAAVLLLLPGIVFGLKTGAPHHAKSSAVSPHTNVAVNTVLAERSLSFEPNLGQADDHVKFLARGKDYRLSLTDSEAVLTFQNGADDVVRMKFLGSNASAKIAGVEKLPGKINYLVGNDPGKWRTEIPTYAKVEYQDIYPGIDLIYYGNQRQVEYDLVVKPANDPKLIRLGFPDNNKLSINKQGDLVLQTAKGELRLQKPYIYQHVNGAKARVEGRYVLKGRNKNEAGFKIARYDRRRPLIIDPVLTYSTYLDQTGNGSANAIAVDGQGNIYITGNTTSATGFPTVNALQTTNHGHNEAYVMKLNANGSALIYSTFLGGSEEDRGDGIAVDSQGNAYVIGCTTSFDFPTSNPLQATFYGGSTETSLKEWCQNGDAFVAKLNPTGSALVYSTYLGGHDSDVGIGIAVDTAGNAYITGGTFSTDFPTTANAFQAVNHGAMDAFVAKLSADGSAFVYSTYLGGSAGFTSPWPFSNGEAGYGIAIDSSGNAYVGGVTGSADFPTTSSAFQRVCVSCNFQIGFVSGFVTKLNPDGSSLFYSTFLGGSYGARIHALVVDASGSVYVTGGADGLPGSTDFPTLNPVQATFSPNWDAFASKLNADGSGLVYSTLLGGNGWEFGEGIAVDLSDSAYIIGSTNSTDFPTVNALQASYNGDVDVVVFKLSASGSALVYSTYLGGGLAERGADIFVDSSGSAYVTGLSCSQSESPFPTVNPLFATNTGGCDAFISKIASSSLTINAGDNVTITTDQQANTVLPGAVTDIEGDNLTYRWLEGTYVLRDTAPVDLNGAALLNLADASVPPFSIGEHTLTLEGSDGQATATDTMILTVNNSPPVVAPAGGGTVQIGSEIILQGQVTDYDGDQLTYQWFEGPFIFQDSAISTVAGGAPVDLPPYTIEGALPMGQHVITLQAGDGINALVSGNITVTVVDTTAPALQPLASPVILWPPDHRMVDVVIQANTSDNSGQVTLAASVASSEPPQVDGSGNTIPDFTTPVINQSTGVIDLQLRAERGGQGGGRTYDIVITATDISNNSSTAMVQIVAPHDRGKK